MEYKIADHIAAMKPSAIREIFKVLVDPEVIALSAGSPDPGSYPTKEMAAIGNDIFANDLVTTLQYGTTEGYIPLREQTKKRLMEKYQTGTEDDDVIITTGGQQTISLFTQTMINRGDVVVCEEPSFIGALNAFRSFGAQLKGVPMDEEGMRMDKLEEVLATTENVKFIYVIPTFQNPSGRTMSLERRKQLLEIAKKYDVLILEDNPYFELRYEGEPVATVKSMDTEGRVVYAGSYSKVLSPGMRIGFCLANKDIINRMVVCKQVSDVHTNMYFQMLVSRYLDTYDLDAHIKDICDLHKIKRDAMLAALDKYVDKRVTFTHPNGGLFIWGELPEGYDSFKLCQEITKRKVACVPGNAFATDESAVCNGFRMNFSMPSLENIEIACQRIGETVAEFLK
ncbi:PLP-dependent aminotransferase family protein [Butyricicoccus sp.]|uniref:aminotransferase-like domain-containing protein n=1 Tax=Butyricicoccus sp. TaxID=2049021 RepID=UPI003F180779